MLFVQLQHQHALKFKHGIISANNLLDSTDVLFMFLFTIRNERTHLNNSKVKVNYFYCT